jgi:prevent-host-death family protein
MAKIIAQRDLRNDNAKLMNEVVAGESFVVTRNGVPVAELLPLRAHRQTVVSKAAVLQAIANGTHINAAQFRKDLDEAIVQDL